MNFQSPATSDAAAQSWGQLLEHYPVLAGLPEAQLRMVHGAMHWMTVPAGTTIFDEHQACNGFPFLLRGSIRVAKAAANGRELALYRVEPGGTCIITTSCLLGAIAYNARGVAEEPTRLALLAAKAFDELLQTPAFRQFVFTLFSERICALMELVDAVAFRRLDERLAALLLRAPELHASHQQIADELGSVREIISRLLKTFADQGMIGLRRGHIEVRDAGALRQIAGTVTKVTDRQG